ncbi:UHRF1-binding protein 1-like isoform X3 [Girardinichthys multiradiatus]|uniref:UHRF1-binding protein 1-like isoform X3 n=1 Tax=Girardinichthys multiradiatus TaxID=208333 RepID=UPI001FAC6D62|nr:UHRF1-binding protein 1-like isoform X3 [Girardinichthys multiradiatus]
MAGLIKKQILKHLSRFAKNLSPDKINLSTLKGEGQLTNLELDEEVLQSLLDLPTWLAINRVFCNKAAIRIPWTKLKTHPISLNLDKVIMEMSTCDEPRPPNGPSPIATASGQSEYGFAEKVVEGISLSINSIVIKISAKAFNASFELSQLQVYSVNTSWSIGDLRSTRIQDPQRGEILTFKEISWQMIRIEADAIQSAEHEMLSAPIRLITNQSKIRVTLKRRMKDCNVVASKLILILDDLLWVLTDSQLKAMVQYAKSLSEAMEKSAQQRKSMAADDQVSSPPPTAQQVRTQQASTAADQSATMAKLFSAYDVCETSHHLQVTHLDLHICDDIHAKDKATSRRITGGAMQLSFSSITFDYYPFHKAGDSCVHWMHYSEATKTRESWAKSLLDEFQTNVDSLKSAFRDRQGPGAAHSSPHHVSLKDEVYEPLGSQEKAEGEVGLREADGGLLDWSPHTQPPPQCCWCLEPGKINTSSSSTSFSPPPPQTPKTQLMSSSFVLRMADFSIYQVSTADQRRSSPKTMISCNKKSLYLPPEMPAIHVEFTEYYFPDGKDYPIPCPNLYAQLNALQLVLDPRSLVWINLFALELRQSLEQFMEIYKLNDSQKPDEHVDIKVDGLMLKLVVPTDQDASCAADLPCSISIQTSEMVATNTRHPSNCTRSHLEAVLQAFEGEPFFSPSFSSFPRSPSSVPILHPAFQQHAHEQDTKLHNIYRGLVVPTMGADALKMPAATDFWVLHFAQFWVDYEGTRGGKGRPQPFVDSFPLTVWACQPTKLVQHQEKLKDSAGPGLSRSSSVEAVARLQRKRMLKEYYSTDSAPASTLCNNSTLLQSNGLHKPHSLDSLPNSNSSLSSSKDADVHLLVHVQKPLSAQVSHQQYVFLMHLLRSLKTLQQTLQQDLEEMASKREHKDTSRHPADHKPFTFCLGLLLKSAEVSLLMKPIPQQEGSGSPVGSELSPSESRGTLEPASDAGEGSVRGNEESGCEDRGAAKQSCTVDQLLCGSLPEEGATLGPTPLIPSSSSRERTPSKNTERGAANEGGEGVVDGSAAGAEVGSRLDSKTIVSDPLSDLSDKEKPAAANMPQSISSGRLMRDRSQSSFSVSYKNMKKSPSLQSLDNISIDSNPMEDGDTYSLMERDDVSISGFKDAISEQSLPESATEAVTVQGKEGAASPDSISATSQSIDETTKDTVSVLVLKVQSMCVGMEAVGESSAVALEVGRVTPNQLGNISLREYHSNRSLGMVCSVPIPAQSSQAGGGTNSESSRGLYSPEVRARLESGPSAATLSSLAEQNGFLQLHLHGYNASFLMASLRNLALFLDGDHSSNVLPMEIRIKDTHIDLKGDDPCDDPPDGEPSAITLHVDSLIVHRQDDGSFSIGVDGAADAKPEKILTDSSLSPVPKAVSSVCRTAKATQTQTPPASPRPTTREKMLLEENECLKVELSRAKMALAEAQMEKDSLLHRMKNLKINTS